jgi:hypothetical protein
MAGGEEGEAVAVNQLSAVDYLPSPSEQQAREGKRRHSRHYIPTSARDYRGWVEVGRLSVGRHILSTLENAVSSSLKGSGAY